jgi:uncharacterized protein (TIGR02596 family)
MPILFPSLHARAFSLLELLLVMALLGILAAAAFGGYAALTQATALTTGAGMLSDTLTGARQDAVARNMTVEVRLYDLATAAQPTAAYRALQLHWLEADGTTPAIEAPLLLPAAVIIDASAAHSPLIAGNSEVATADPADPRLNGQTRVFHFLPDGSTDLDPTAEWFVTLRAATTAASALFPNDWACVAIDPTTGRVQVYRP